MLITFKSKAAADVVMYKTHAQPIFDLLEKSPDQGIITAEEIPDALTKLEALITESKREQSAKEESQKNSDPDNMKNENGSGHEPAVGFAVRAFPFVEMLRAAKREGKFITWGV